MDDNEMMENTPPNTPPISFNNFVNNNSPRLPHNSDDTTSMARYIGEVMMGGIPKMLIIISGIANESKRFCLQNYQ